MVEWLTREIRTTTSNYLILFEGAGSNPAGVGFLPGGPLEQSQSKLASLSILSHIFTRFIRCTMLETSFDDYSAQVNLMPLANIN